MELQPRIDDHAPTIVESSHLLVKGSFWYGQSTQPSHPSESQPAPASRSTAEVNSAFALQRGDEG